MVDATKFESELQAARDDNRRTCEQWNAAIESKVAEEIQRTHELWVEARMRLGRLLTEKYEATAAQDSPIVPMKG